MQAWVFVHKPEMGDAAEEAAVQAMAPARRSKNDRATMAAMKAKRQPAPGLVPLPLYRPDIPTDTNKTMLETLQPPRGSRDWFLRSSASIDLLLVGVAGGPTRGPIQS